MNDIINFFLSNITDSAKVFLITIIYIFVVLILFKLALILINIVYDYSRFLRLRSSKFFLKDFNLLSSLSFSDWSKSFLSKIGFKLLSTIEDNKNYSLFKVSSEDDTFLVLALKHNYSLFDRYFSESYIHLLVGALEEVSLKNCIFISNGFCPKHMIDFIENDLQNCTMIDGSVLYKKYDIMNKGKLYFKTK